jgi:hypothetical protein
MFLISGKIQENMMGKISILLLRYAQIIEFLQLYLSF